MKLHNHKEQAEQITIMEDLQRRVADLVEKLKLGINPEHRLLDIVAELGEVSKELLLMTDYGSEEMNFRSKLGEEMGDLLFSIIALANQFDISLHDQLQLVLKKYQNRFENSGTIGSEAES